MQAPSAIRSLGPFASGELIWPGTAPTSRPISVAKRAEIKEPELPPPSTTRVILESPAMIRLRAGKHHRGSVLHLEQRLRKLLVVPAHDANSGRARRPPRGQGVETGEKRFRVAPSSTACGRDELVVVQ